MEIILNKHMNCERRSIFMALALQQQLISRYFKHIASSQKLNDNERKSILIYCALLRVKSLQLSWSLLDQKFWPVADIGTEYVKGLVWKRLGHLVSQLTGILTNFITDQKDSITTVTDVSAFQVTKFTIFLSVVDLPRNIFLAIFMG